MSKDPTPRADALRAQREARYGHLQATAVGLSPQPVNRTIILDVIDDPVKPPRKRRKLKRKTE